MIACPEGYDPFSAETMERAQRQARENGAPVRIVRDLHEAVDGADVIHCKNWVPINFSDEHVPPHFENPERYKPWIINSDVVNSAKKDVIVMHALPAYRGYEIADEVIEGPHSVVFDETENRLHAQKAVMCLVMG